jgi:hypothetical protein
MTPKIAAVFVATWGTLLVIGPLRPLTFFGLALVALGVLILEAPSYARFVGPAIVAALEYWIFSRGSSRMTFFLWVVLVCLLIKMEFERRRSLAVVSQV